MNTPLSVFWFRRDLRLHDNAGLFHALKGPYPVLPVFIFDRNILNDLTDKQDARVTFIYNTLGALKQALEKQGSSLLVFIGTPEEVWPMLLDKYRVGAVYTNRDYEPYAIERDAAVHKILTDRGIPFQTFKDHVIFEKDEVLKADRTPYTVFTPYSKRWLEKLYKRPGLFLPKSSYYLESYPVEKHLHNLFKTNPLPFPTIQETGFELSPLDFPPATVARGLIRNYDKTRDIPGIQGTSRLGIHFRFGTISIREKARHAQELSGTYLKELIWRDFYSQILAHFPQVADHAFRPQYDRIEWRDAPDDFEKWRLGRTGYPIVDAGMRELNATGYMHNRVRMIVASFLSKHLLLDWRMGEAYFAEKLLDYDLASNSGGWQWAAGCGTDAAPYFRIFNPVEQQKKFDPRFEYVKQWVPEFGTPEYPEPMVDHVFARERCLRVYKRALQS